ncbi:MAG: Rieske 2Fe-2S domain-containing protein [Thermoplasmata archaeon]
MPKRIRVASVSEIPPGTMKTVEVEDLEILIANVDGQFRAMGAICTHQEWDLSEGTLAGSRVTCAGHGSVWNVETGEGEWVRPIPPLPVYEVTAVGDDVLVEFQAPAKGH